MKTSSLLLSDFFEPVFYRFDDSYRSDNCPNADKLEHYLISKIRSNHKDMDSHVRRVLLNIEHQRKPQLLGALQDLYVVLGGRGKPIKNTLLERSQSILSEEHLTHFRIAIEQYKDYTPVETPHSYLHNISISASLQQNKNIIGES